MSEREELAQVTDVAHCGNKPDRNFSDLQPWQQRIIYRQADAVLKLLGQGGWG